MSKNKNIEIDAARQIKKRKSKLWNLIKLVYPDIVMEEMWLTFGKTIWTPGHISNDLIMHEAIHVSQQKNWFLAIFWWIRYTASAEFRYSQELPAYKMQMNYLCDHVYRGREQQFQVRRSIALIMSGPKYKRMVSYDQAMKDLSS